MGDPLTVIGFGRTSEGGTASDQLLRAQVDYVDTQACANVFAGENQVVPSIMMCAERPGADA